MEASQEPTWLKLYPDGYSRFFVALEILKKTVIQDPIHVLDVGGSSPYLFDFMKESERRFDLTILDILPPHQEPDGFRYIQGDGTKMNGITDNAYQAVVSIDSLEHIPNTGKEAFVRECVRVARDLVIIGAPFNEPGVTEAEHHMNAFHNTLFGTDHRWLKEHFEMGLPETRWMEDLLKTLGYEFLRLGSSHLPTWVLDIHLSLLPAGTGLRLEDVEDCYRSYNRHLLEMGDFEPPHYRQFYVIFKNSALKQSRDLYLPQSNNPVKMIDYHARIMQLLGTELKKRMHPSENE